MNEKELEERGWAEDTCRYCGVHVGYGPPELHIGVCGEGPCQQKAKRAGKRRTKRYTKRRR